MISLACFQCEKDLTFSDRVGLREECPFCGEDVHVCKNCDFFDEKVYNECREPQAERQREKERANRCDYFQPRTQGRCAQNSKDALRAAAEALFKKK